MSQQSCSAPLQSTSDLQRHYSEASLNSSLLVTSETNQHPLQVQSHAQECVHQAVERMRTSIIGALWNSGDQALGKRAEKMGLCCVAPMIFADAARDPVCVAGYCRDRLCPTCMRRRASKVKSQLVALISKMNAPRFLTLTERDNTDPLAQRMDRITSAVRRLRHTQAWKRHVKGGVMVWETTRNEAKGTWHPHVHLIIDGDFWAHASVLAEWKKALQGDGAARIEACHDRTRSARYLAKYLAKDTEIAAWPESTIVEFAGAMHRRRLVATFGAMHKANVDHCDEEKKKPPLPKACISYEQLRTLIDNGDETARKAAPLLARLGIAFRQLFFEFSMPGDCYADELPPTCFAELGSLIEQLHDAQLGVDTPEPEPPPIKDTCTLRLFDETVYR